MVSDEGYGFPVEALALKPMASGHLCLELTDKVDWNRFPAFAEGVLEKLGGQRLRMNNSVDMHLWEVRVDNAELRLVFDDFPTMVSLESSDDRGDEVLKRIFERLNKTG